MTIHKNASVRQRDKETYAVVPHVPCGVITPDTLRKIADVSEKYDAAALKITSAARIAIVGVKEEDVPKAWEDLDMKPGQAIGKVVRSIKACPGTTFCALAKQDALTIGMAIDEKYHGMELPSKTKMAVSGCQNQCAENCIKDASLAGYKNGWTLMAGGVGSGRPRLADVIAEELETEEALAMFDRLIDFYKNSANKAERIGRMIDRIGLDAVKAAVAGDKAAA
ncbi:NAD(P)/FAD-dependent oxidoreductase [Desulfoluna limicola]|jgi:NAD(P)H-nitrite reductase large subunit|uniref:NAD(P)/FAD-dependent oxidoreductase n=1 Tax=Desulfoluna limicola TaxID=2810562 RepID=A0ABM7PMI3_9BACT|nr:NAD(P)/FAD-dependent oxidoreductase [Desulfoluna limicola]BCS98679.1 NAD(P)/FAD-dependent oxidoreductase [Desulfoluna limicola]